MAISSGFFRSVSGDRKYTADFFSSYFASFIGNGVFPNPSTNLQALYFQQRTVIIKAGKAWINGHYLINDADLGIMVGAPSPNLNRIDRIVVGLNNDTREMSIYIKSGEPSINAIAPSLTRDNTIYELALADIIVNPNSTTLSQANIIDQRFNNELCGIVTGVVQQIDTTTLFNQFQQALLDFENVQEADFLQWSNARRADFEAWYADVMDVLDGDVAANLNDKINMQEEEVNKLKLKTSGLINAKEFGSIMESNNIVGNNVSLQLAIESARNAFIESNGNKGQVILLESGIYELNDTVTLYPYVKLKSLGTVIFDIKHNGTGIHITANPNDPQYFNTSPGYLYKNSWNRGKYLDGSNGPMVFTSSIDLENSNVIGLEVGARESYTAFRPTSRYVISHCAFYNVNVSIKMNVFHNFIGTFEQIHSEVVNHHLIYGNETEIANDSGENFVFIGGVYAGAKRQGFIFNVGGADFSFNNISFDFNADKLFNPRASGNYIRLNQCYFEVIQTQGYIYHAQPRSINETTGRNGLYFNDVIGLFREPRQLIKNDAFNGARIELAVNISSLEIRFITTFVPTFRSVENSFFLNTDENINLFAKNFILQNTQRVALDKNLNFLSDNDFSQSALGNFTNNNNASWSVEYGNCSGAIVANGINNTNALNITIVPNVNNYCRLETKKFYDAKPGQIISVFGSVFILETSRTTQTNGGVLCYDNNDNLITSLTQFGSLTSNTLVTNSGGFNYPIILSKLKLPKGTVKIKPFFIVANANMNYRINDVVAILEG